MIYSKAELLPHYTNCMRNNRKMGDMSAASTNVTNHT